MFLPQIIRESHMRIIYNNFTCGRLSSMIRGKLNEILRFLKLASKRISLKVVNSCILLCACVRTIRQMDYSRSTFVLV